MRWYVGGQQKLMPELLAMVACTVNSYSRLIPGFWAPTSATWGVENRTTALRVIPGGASSQRVEYRIAAADINPYLALAVAIGSGLYGIENRIEPDPMVEGNAYDKKFPKTRSLPRTLTEASEWLEKSKAGRALFGDAFVEHYAASREWEDREFRRAITDWELARYFEIIMNHSGIQKTISPVDGRVYVERPLATSGEINEALRTARHAFAEWRNTSLADRAAILTRFCGEFEKRGSQIAEELTWQMGRPARYAPNEIRGTLERARHMIAIAPQALGDVDTDPKDNFRRFVRREPLGVVFTVAAWNYPFLIAVNSVVPALMAGNVVLLKHSAQTPLAAERFAECLAAAGLPKGVFQVLHASHEDTDLIIRDPRVDFVAFTGSVAGGRAVQRAAAQRFIGVGLELGGCDPVYVRHDANLDHAIENIVDGAYFNSGQSCCGLQRDLRASRALSQVHGRLCRAHAQVFIGRPDRRGHHARAPGAHRGGRRRAQADRRRPSPPERLAPFPKARSRRAAPARRILRRRCCWTWITTCRSCARRSSGPSPAS